MKSPLRLYRVLFIYLFFLPSLFSQNSKSTFDIRAWVLLDYNMSYLRQMIPLAAQEGINHLQLCHRIGMQLSDYLEPRRNKDVQELIDLAHSYGIKTYVWTHELDEVPVHFYKGGKIAAYGEKFWKWMAQRYETLLEAIPQVDGVVVTLTETKAPIDDDNLIVSPLTPAQRFSQMAQTIYDVLHPRGKELILRTFTWIEEDYDWMLEAFSKLPKDIIIMSKVNWGDWFQHFPPNPFIGAVAPHPQLIEYDLAGQYHGDTFTPWVCTDFLQQQMQYGLTKKAKGVIARVDWSGHVYGSANEFNAVAFAALAKNPIINLNNLWIHWASEKYSPEAAAHVISALKRSNKIANLIYFTLSFKIIQLSGSLMSLSYMDGTRIMHSLFCRDVQARWRPELLPIANELLNPTRNTVDKVIAEKKYAMTLIDTSLKDLKQAQPYLTGESYVYLTTLFQRAKLMALSWRWITEAYFRYVLVRKGDISQSESLNIALDNVLKLSEKVEECFSEPIYLLQPERMRNFVYDIRVILKSPVKWIATTNLQSMRKPLLLDIDSDGEKEVIVNAQDNGVHAFKEPGVEVWKHKTLGLRVWYPNISDPIVSDLGQDGRQGFMIGAADGELYTFNQNGKLIWKYRTDDGILAAPVVVKNKNNTVTIICASLDGYLYGLDSEGVLVWKIKIDGVVNRNLIAVGAIVYLVTQEGVVKAFSASGKELWQFMLPDKLTGALAMHEINGTKIISVASGPILTLLNLNGTIHSSFSLDDVKENIAVAARCGQFFGEDAVFMGSDKGNFYIISKYGDVILKTKLGREIRTPVKVLQEPPSSVLLLGVDNAIVALNSNGEEIWRFTAAHDALVGNDFLINRQEKEIIFTAQDRKLYVIDLKQIWFQNK